MSHMKTNLTKIIGYHYTNGKNYQYMQNGEMYRKKGLIPIKRFINLSIGQLPNEAHDGVVEGLL